jgi:hypothetical protein
MQNKGGTQNIRRQSMDQETLVGWVERAIFLRLQEKYTRPQPTNTYVGDRKYCTRSEGWGSKIIRFFEPSHLSSQKTGRKMAATHWRHTRKRTLDSGKNVDGPKLE